MKKKNKGKIFFVLFSVLPNYIHTRVPKVNFCFVLSRCFRPYSCYACVISKTQAFNVYYTNANAIIGLAVLPDIYIYSNKWREFSQSQHDFSQVARQAYELGFLT